MRPARLRIKSWNDALRESTWLAFDSVRVQPLRSTLAIMGVVIGIVTVVLVASVLVNVRNQVALLFRELGTENVFAFHLTGDPYQAPSEAEARRKPLKPAFAAELARIGPSIRDSAVQLLVPPIVGGRPLMARAGDNEADTVLVEGASPNFFEVVGAEFAAGRPFTELEDRSGAKVAVIGASLSRALFGARRAVGRTLVLGGETYFVVGELAPRRGGFFGENRQDLVLSIPLGTVLRRYSEAENTVLYVRARPGQVEQARTETEAILRRLRRLGPGQDNDFTLSTSDSIIRIFDELSTRIGLVTVVLAGVSLFIGGIGIANVMIIGVTERTREIGLRLALGASRREVLGQFLIEAALLSTAGGVTGVILALLLGVGITFVVSGFSAVVPVWAIAAGVSASLGVGVVAGYWPARRASALDPVEALRYE
jgi:putative ABC transport system permease protein